MKQKIKSSDSDLEKRLDELEQKAIQQKNIVRKVLDGLKEEGSRKINKNKKESN